MTANPRTRSSLIAAAGSILAHGCLGLLLVVALQSSTPTSRPSPPSSAASSGPTGDDGGPRGFESQHAGDENTVAATSAPVDIAVIQRAALQQAVDNTTRHSPGVLFHLWESTIVAAIVAMIALLSRRHGAHLRYGLWLVASLKFLFPFSILTALGGYAGALLPARPSAQSIPGGTLSMFDPFAVTGPVPLADSFPAAGPSIGEWAQVAAVVLWGLGVATLATLRLMAWRRVKATLRTSTPIDLPHINLPAGVELRTSPGLLEPGVVGWRAPVLLLPANIEEQLSKEELKAIVAHEICHIRRRDNLTAAMHMVTETIFWFHPAVWWIGARLLVERERACDEAVVAGGGEPVTYAKAIVNTCALYTASPVSCVAGVTGSNLRQRIETILRNESPVAMRRWAKAAVLITAVLVLMVPIGRGMLSAIPLVHVQPVMAFSAGFPPPPESDAQNRQMPGLEVASVRPSAPDRPMRLGPVLQDGGRVLVVNTPLRNFIASVYGVGEDRVLGGPAWIDSAGYDIEARVAAGTSPADVRLLLRSLLSDRFQLVLRSETRELPVFVLRTVASAGRQSSGLRRSGTECVAPTRLPGPGGPPPPPPPPAPGVYVGANWGDGPTARCPSINAAGVGFMSARATTMERFAIMLTPIDGRPVVNQTGLAGEFDFDLRYTPDAGARGEIPAAVNAPALPTALREQLGLRLDGERRAVEVLVIDRVERPAAN